MHSHCSIHTRFYTLLSCTSQGNLMLRHLLVSVIQETKTGNCNKLQADRSKRIPSCYRERQKPPHSSCRFELEDNFINTRNLLKSINPEDIWGIHPYELPERVLLKTRGNPAPIARHSLSPLLQQPPKPKMF